MKRIARRAWCPALVLLALAAAGCSPMGRFDVVVTLDHQGFRQKLGTIPSVEVNLIGINLVEFPEWENGSVTAYWQPDNAQRLTGVRKGIAHVMTFGEDRVVRETLERTNRIWDAWAAREAMNLFILVNYPRIADDKPGNADARRLILPLAKLRWSGYLWGKRTILIEVAPSGLICQTPPRPEVVRSDAPPM